MSLLVTLQRKFKVFRIKTFPCWVSSGVASLPSLASDRWSCACKHVSLESAPRCKSLASDGLLIFCLSCVAAGLLHVLLGGYGRGEPLRAGTHRQRVHLPPRQEAGGLEVYFLHGAARRVSTDPVPSRHKSFSS